MRRTWPITGKTSSRSAWIWWRSTLIAEGKLHCDFSRFDRWAQVFWDTGRMDLMETGFVAQHGKGGWSSREIGFRDFDVQEATTGGSKRLSGREFLPQFLPALVDHLRQKQWLNKTIFHICDEPADHNVMAWREASGFVYRCARNCGGWTPSRLPTA